MTENVFETYQGVLGKMFWSLFQVFRKVILLRTAISIIPLQFRLVMVSDFRKLIMLILTLKFAPPDSGKW